MQQCKELSSIKETRRKIVSKKVLKQARFYYKSKHCHYPSALPSALTTQLGSLSLNENLSNNSKLQGESFGNLTPLKHNLPKSVDSLPKSSPSTSSLTDCTGLFNEITFNSKDILPSFHSLKLESQLSSDSSSTSPKQNHLHDYKNSKHFYIKKRRKENPHDQPVFSDTQQCCDLTSTNTSIATTCAQEAHISDVSAAVCEISAYMENFFVLPKKMSTMAEMMYT